VQELCGLSKHLQVNNRGLLLTNLNNLGLFEVRSATAREVTMRTCVSTLRST